MKLIIAIVQDRDANKLMKSLIKENFKITKLASSGGFLKSGNTTLMIGIKEEYVDRVIAIIGDICKTREETLAAYSTTEATGIYVPYLSDSRVEVGGATIFTVDVEKYVKV